MRHPIITQALELLACEARETDLLTSPGVVRDYLRLLLGDKPHEVFAVVFLDAQNRVIANVQRHADSNQRLPPRGRHCRPES